MSDSTEQKDSNARYWLMALAILIGGAILYFGPLIAETDSREAMTRIFNRVDSLQQAYCLENGTYASSFTELGADSILGRRYAYTLYADSATYVCTIYDPGHSEGEGREQAGLVDQTGAITFIDYDEVRKAGRVIWVPINSLHTTIDIR